LPVVGAVESVISALFGVNLDKAQAGGPLAQIVSPVRPPGVHQDAVGQRDGTVGRRLNRIAHGRSMRRARAVNVQSSRKFRGVSALAVEAGGRPRRTPRAAWPGGS